MCGIAGKLYFDRNRKIEEGLLERMSQTLVHRGPDDKGEYEDYNFGFAMRRLSIIDIEGGHQPMFNDDHTLGIVFNGEVYNFESLRAELKSKGHSFRTQSDTEVILRCYQEYGETFVERLNGMFAIALWDARNQKLVLARDRVGIKPLYYYQDDTKLLFASEIKAILEDQSVERKVNPKALDAYLSFMYVPAPLSMFEGVQKLLPGHILVYENNHIEIKKYWDVSYEQDYSKSVADYTEEFKFLLKDSVRLRMISDVPVGAFLSGGIDSSSVVAMMSQLSDQPVKTFSIGFKEGGYHDEKRFAQMVADRYNTEHHTFDVDSGLLDLLSDYVTHFDEPFADYAAFPTYVLSRFAKEHVSVVLTGDGCDEIFAGYERYASEYWARRYKAVPRFVREKVLLPALGIGKRFSTRHRGLYDIFQGAQKKTRLMECAGDQRYIKGLYCFDDMHKRSVLTSAELIDRQYAQEMFSSYLNDKAHLDDLSRQLYLDTKTSLPEDMLTKVDRVSMAVSLEARVPFLDHRMVEFAASVPSAFKMNGWHLKKFVREAVGDLLPVEIIKRPKHGFSSPIDAWFREDLRDLVRDTLSDSNIKAHGFFQAETVRTMIDHHMSAKANNGHQLFMLMVFQLWYERFINERVTYRSEAM